jgi:mycothiol synthase
MVLESLNHLPSIAIAPDYRIRTYQPGDERDWCRIVNMCIGGDYTESQCRAELTEDQHFRPADLFFAVREGAVVGTACALRNPDLGFDVGSVHMVAVEPEHRGNRLGWSLVVAVLHRLRELGCGAAVLLTDDFRLSAINIYLELGFRPRMAHESHEPRWQEVRRRLAERRRLKDLPTV